MKHFFRKLNKTAVILLSSLLLIPFLFPFDPALAKPVEEIVEQDVPASAEETKPETTGQKKCLFIGNSKTYFNNLPEMYKNIVSAGTGEELSCSSLTYGHRSEVAHGRAVKAVVRTKGDASALTEREKRFFTLNGVKDAAAFCEDVYQTYANVLLDKEGNVRTFDYIIIQMFSPRYNYKKRE